MSGFVLSFGGNSSAHSLGRAWGLVQRILSLCLCLGACVIWLSSAGQEAFGQEESGSGDSESAKYASQTGTFRLKVAGPNGEAIPGAKVDLRFSPRPAIAVIHGQDLGAHRYGRNLKSDDQGVLEFRLPKQALDYLSAGITAKGYGLFWARWDMTSKSERLPAEYLAELDGGQSFGGVVVDSDGRPIVGAQVHPSIEYKKRKSDLSQLSSGKRYSTDESGSWRVDVVPASVKELSVSISHPDFQKISQRLSVQEFGLKTGDKPSATTTLLRGLTVRGTVRDAKGKPLAQAILRARVENRTLQAVTDAQGRYSLNKLSESTINLVATEKGSAPEMQTVTVRRDMSPVDFELKEGNQLRVVVRDQDGKPVPKSRVFFQDWRGKSHDDELDKVHSYTDENGVWIWENAPSDPIRVDICPPNSMQLADQMIQAGQANEFVSVPVLSIRGLVVDASTGKKINAFRVVPGVIWPNRDAPFWIQRDSFESGEGLFTFKETRVDGKIVLRVEADGYAPYTSRAVEWDEGRVGLAVKLQAAEPTVIQVLQPNGEPASGAEIALGIQGSQIGLQNGEFGSSTYADRLTSDQEGRFTLKPQLEQLVLFARHETGYVARLFDPQDSLESLQLEAWATVKGLVRHGSEPAEGVKLRLSPNLAFFAQSLPSASHQYSVATDANGRFEFRQVVPGKFTIGQSVEAFRSSSGMRTGRSHVESQSVHAGETLELSIGGVGHRLSGRLVMPAGVQDPYDWEFCMPKLQCKVVVPEIPYPEELVAEEARNKWVAEWMKTKAGQGWRAANTRAFEATLEAFRTHVAADGSFEIFSVQPGEYWLEVELGKPGTYARGEDLLAKLKVEVRVPEFEQEFQTHDLGQLELELVEHK